ncbi:MAG: UbiX family flavin prenyltransferase [Anaerolineales bacterium]
MNLAPKTIQRLVVGISGATGIIYAIRLLEIARDIEGIETHLVVSSAAVRTLSLETDYSLQQVKALANESYNFSDIGASIASGSFKTMGMVVVPCSVKTLSGVANCYSENLLLRAADVTLKERRPLVLSLRETPLHSGHVRLMLQACEMGAILAPPMPAFYTKPTSLQDLVDHHVFKILDLLKIDFPEENFKRWQGG